MNSYTFCHFDSTVEFLIIHIYYHALLSGNYLDDFICPRCVVVSETTVDDN